VILATAAVVVDAAAAAMKELEQRDVKVWVMGLCGL
jgi:hypothetical protein